VADLAGTVREMSTSVTAYRGERALFTGSVVGYLVDE
jgi:hypothetical protein